MLACNHAALIDTPQRTYQGTRTPDEEETSQMPLIVGKQNKTKSDYQMEQKYIGQ